MLNEMHLTVQEETINKYAFLVSFNLDIFFGATCHTKALKSCGFKAFLCLKHYGDFKL